MRQFLPRPLGGSQLDPEGNGAGLCCRARTRIAMDPHEVNRLNQTFVQFILFRAALKAHGVAALRLRVRIRADRTVRPQLFSLHGERRPPRRQARGADAADARQGGTRPEPATQHTEAPLAVSETETPGPVIFRNDRRTASSDGAAPFKPVTTLQESGDPFTFQVILFKS